MRTIERDGPRGCLIAKHIIQLEWRGGGAGRITEEEERHSMEGAVPEEAGQGLSGRLKPRTRAHTTTHVAPTHCRVCIHSSYQSLASLTACSRALYFPSCHPASNLLRLLFESDTSFAAAPGAPPKQCTILNEVSSVLTN
jgi:hypothetical protein